MPLQFEEVEISLAGGLDEKTARLLRTPGVLRHARNVDTRQAGVLRKRRGYERVDLDPVVNDSSNSEEVFHALAKFREELVVVGHDYLYALASLAGNLTGDAASATLVRRGPMIRGAFDIQHVASSSLGDVT